MRRRIFIGIFLTSLLTCIVASIMFASMCYISDETEVKQNLRSEFLFFKNNVLKNGTDFLGTVPADYGIRITLIRNNGSVVYDTSVPSDEMENHYARPEFISALKNGKGEGSRISHTLARKTCYYAERLPDGNVLRVSAGMDSIYYRYLRMLPWMTAIMILLTAVLTFLAHYQTYKIMRPINNMVKLSGDNDVEAPYQEMEPFIGKIRDQSQKIRAQLHELKTNELEFRLITANMTEGLLLIGSDGTLRFQSPAAGKFLRMAEMIKDDGSLNYDCSSSVTDALRQAIKEKKDVSITKEYSMRCLNFIFNPLPESGGAVAVIIDVTESAERSRLRREFSANVSHELKTPLTAISGFAEIINSGIAKPEDIKHFAGKIMHEADRLLNLIRDIINLSALDDGASLMAGATYVDVRALFLNIIYCLNDAAANKKIEVEYTGSTEPIYVHGIQRLLEECLYNLIDNAIRYSNQGGKVKVSAVMSEDNKSIVCTVSDNGIGIPEECQDQIYERFFRVDKSHSRDMGGTGLGLSIVKHVVMLHKGTIALKSRVGEGAVFTVTFPGEIFEK